MSNLASMDSNKRGVDINTSLYHFPIDDVTLTDGDFDLFGNGHESSYLSYQGWPDTSSYTGEFFRFGKGNSTNWFSSSESAFNSLLPHSHQNTYSTLDHSSYTNCERKPEFLSGMQPDRLRRKLLKNHEQTDGKREDQTSKYASGGSFLIPVTAQQFANPTERSSHSSQNVITLTTEQNTDKLQWNCQMQDFSSNKFQQEGLVNHSAFTEQVPLHTQLHQTQDGVKGHCRVEKVITEHPNLDTDSSVILDCSVISSAGSTKLSAEETSFRKLHHVLEQFLAIWSAALFPSLKMWWTDTEVKVCLYDLIAHKRFRQNRGFGSTSLMIYTALEKFLEKKKHMVFQIMTASRDKYLLSVRACY